MFNQVYFAYAVCCCIHEIRLIEKKMKKSMGNLWMCIDITLLPISDRYISYINFLTIEQDYPKTYYTF